MDREIVVAALLKAAGGELTGSVRFQKAVYLLDQLGLDTGFRYKYHHYGPFSPDLDTAVADAKALSYVQEDFGHRQIDGARYSVFKLNPADSDLPEHIGQLDGEDLKEHLQRFVEADVTVLELAATAHWLAAEEGLDDWQDELRRRKPIRAQGGRLVRALELLRDVGLPPAKADEEPESGL